MIAKLRNTLLRNKIMEISSDNLYHYTCKENLKTILLEGFKPSYCREVLIGADNNKYDIAVPMVCFCDLPSELAEKHRINYKSNYAIGLSSDWRIRNRLNPLLYLVENSLIWKQFSELLTLIADMKFKDSNKKMANSLNTSIAGFYFTDPDISKLKNIYFSIITEAKLFKGKRYDSNGNMICEDYNFYNEREWRFVDDSLEKYIILKNDTLEKIRQQIPINNHLLKFNIKDIRHIIVEKQNEIDEFKKILELNSIIGGEESSVPFDISSIKITPLDK